jgi:hypothetical protein
MIGTAAAPVNHRRGLWTDRRTLAAMDIWRCRLSFAILATSPPSAKGAVMFEELSEELLDLSAGVRGVGNAVYAATQDDPGSCSLCCSFVLCCCCTLCW